MLLNHPFHVVSPSFLPLAVGLTAFTTATSLAAWFHGYPNSNFLLLISFLLLLLTVIIWFRQIMIEADLAFHTDSVKQGLMLGIWLMIISEGAFFAGLIWACLHTGLAPTINLQLIWPPIGIEPVAWDKRSLVMTFVLASSFCTANLCISSLLSGNRFYTAINLAITIFMGFLFLVGQYIEYSTTPFTFSDSVFGSGFFLATGYHGLHVLVSVLYLLVCFIHLAKLNNKNHLSLTVSILIYHIVDIVWLVVYSLLYIAVL